MEAVDTTKAEGDIMEEEVNLAGDMIVWDEELDTVGELETDTTEKVFVETLLTFTAFFFTDFRFSVFKDFTSLLIFTTLSARFSLLTSKL